MKNQVLFAITLVCFLIAEQSSFGQGTPSIINNPDAFAWKLFVELNHPADLSKGRGVPDAAKKIGDDGATVWQTWTRTDEIFLAGGVKPPDWNPQGGIKIVPMALFQPTPNAARSPRKLELDKEGGSGFKLLNANDPPPRDDSESSMNQAAFDFVVTNELFNIEGQEAFHKAGKMINMPMAAKEIKSAWLLLSTEAVENLPPEKVTEFKGKYHTKTRSHNGKTYLYGLTALHITSKDLPNWFWATFEHTDNPMPEQPDNDHAGRPTQLNGTKWQHYRLRGTQIDFTDSQGLPTVLANTQLEAGFQQSASCITCHARATIGDPLPTAPGTAHRANRLPFFEVRRLLQRQEQPNIPDQIIQYGSIGAPAPEWFIENGVRRKYTQLDFMWSLRSAKSKAQP